MALTNESNTGGPDPGLKSHSEQFNKLLSTLTTRLDEFDAVQSPGTTNQQQEQEDKHRLQVLASDLLRDSKNLQDTAQKISNPTSRIKAWAVVFKYKFRYRRVINDLERKILKAHDILNTEFLMRIW